MSELGIPRNSYEFSAIQTSHNLRKMEFLGISGNALKSKKFQEILNTLNMKVLIKTRSNSRGLKLWFYRSQDMLHKSYHKIYIRVCICLQL